MQRVLASQSTLIHGAAPRWPLLIDAVEQLASVSTLEQVVDVVRASARGISGADGITFVMREDDQCHYVAEDAIMPLWQGRRFPLTACISGWCMLQARSVVIPNIYADERIPQDAYRPTFVASLVMTPVIVGEPIAAIGAYWAEARAPDAETVELLSALARSTATAVANVRLTTSLRERETALRTLLDELNHRVKNNLQMLTSMLSLMQRETVVPEAQQVLSQATARIAAMAAAQRTLYIANSASRIEAKLLLEAVCASAKALGEAEIAIQTSEGDIANDSAMPLSLIINELVTNAMKYATRANGTPAHIRVALDHSDGHWSLSVHDDGPGFDGKLLARRSSGLQLVDALTRQLRGTFAVSATHPGTRCTVRFPDHGPFGAGGVR